MREPIPGLQRVAVHVFLNGDGALPIAETWIRHVPRSVDEQELEDDYVPEWQAELDGEVIHALRGEVHHVEFLPAE